MAVPSPTVHSRYGLHTRRVTLCVPPTATRLHDRSDQFRLGRSTGGILADWETPPLDGARQELPFPGHGKPADTGLLFGDFRPTSDIPRVSLKVRNASNSGRSHISVELRLAGQISSSAGDESLLQPSFLVPCVCYIGDVYTCRVLLRLLSQLRCRMDS
jgi:hypothetical protein